MIILWVGLSFLIGSLISIFIFYFFFYKKIKKEEIKDSDSSLFEIRNRWLKGEHSKECKNCKKDFEFLIRAYDDMVRKKNILLAYHMK